MWDPCRRQSEFEKQQKDRGGFEEKDDDTEKMRVGETTKEKHS